MPVSGEQPFSETTRASAASLPNWREMLRKKEEADLHRMRILPNVLALEANRVGMANEEQQRQMWLTANHEAIYGASEGRFSGGEEMGDITLGDRVTNNYEAPKKAVGTLTKLAIGAGLLGSGAGTGAGISMLYGGAKEVVEVPAVDTDTAIGLRLKSVD